MREEFSVQGMVAGESGALSSLLNGIRHYPLRFEAAVGPEI